jgi:hypothetical protein
MSECFKCGELKSKINELRTERKDLKALFYKFYKSERGEYTLTTEESKEIDEIVYKEKE